MYMIRVTIDAFDKGIKEISSELMCLHSANKCHVLKLWSDLLLLIEALNEKQVTISSEWNCNFCNFGS